MASNQTVTGDEASVAHTPGPWEIGDSAKGESSLMVYCNDSLGSRVADLSICGHGISTAQARANARLIAAAPELLAACKALDAALCDGFDTTQSRHAGRMALIAARAAITKAEGSK